jgi:homoserine O-acetyltransferase
MTIARLGWLLTISLLVGPSAGQDLKFAELGDYRLENGETILDCRIGYRTFGTLNAHKSNAVLFPTWYSGRSQNLVGLIGAGKLVDPAKYFVIAVDALGNGVSSSPSNSPRQPRMKFPNFSIRDMVDSQYRLVKDVLGVPHLLAVMGISMGGYQAFEWMVAYPDFLEYAIPILGTPLPSSYDQLWIRATADAIRADPHWNGGEYAQPPESGLHRAADICGLVGQTPSYRVRNTPPAEFEAYLEGIRKSFVRMDANNWIRQGEALLRHDISRRFGSDMSRAAAAVKAQVLVIAALQDHEVVPGPALSFARMLGARTLELDSDCGHLAFQCEAARLSVAIAQFLSNGSSY